MLYLYKINVIIITSIICIKFIIQIIHIFFDINYNEQII